MSYNGASTFELRTASDSILRAEAGRAGMSSKPLGFKPQRALGQGRASSLRILGFRAQNSLLVTAYNIEKSFFTIIGYQTSSSFLENWARAFSGFGQI